MIPARPSSPIPIGRLLPWLALLLLSLTLHLLWLGNRTFHHDESIHAKLSCDLAEYGSYRYNPTYHGPLLYYLGAATHHLLPQRWFADRNTVARLPIALTGVCLIGVAWMLRRPFGARAAWWSGLLFTISPTFLYFGRFLRMDLLEVLCASAALLGWYAVLRGEEGGWTSLGIWSALALATKENAFVTAALLVLVALVMAVIRSPRRSANRAIAWLVKRSAGVLTATTLFVLVSMVLYTVFFRYPADCDFPLRAVSYWWGQHQQQRVAGPWWYHLPRLAQYELLVLVAATAWVARRWRRLRNVELFLYLLGSGSILMYAYLGEKVPWLLVHQVWPFVPLAGAQLARTMGRRGRWWSRTLAATGVGLTAVTALVASFFLHEISPDHRRVESLHYVQTSPELLPVVVEGLDLLNRQRNQADSKVVAYGAGIWPLCWYWRGKPVRWLAPEPGSSPMLIICDPPQVSALLHDLDGSYSQERIPLRSWWLMYRKRPTPGEILRYLVTRKPWGYIGSTDVVVLRRRSDAPP